MKIGILSDTHKKVGRAKKAIELLVKQGVKALVHMHFLDVKKSITFGLNLMLLRLKG